MKPIFETIKIKKEVAITFIENSPTYISVGKELWGEVVSIYTAGKTTNNILIPGASPKGEEIMVWIVKDSYEVWIIPYADIKDVEYIK